MPLVSTATRFCRVVRLAASCGFGRDRLAGEGDAGRIGEREVALVGERLGRRDLQLAGPRLAMEMQGVGTALQPSDFEILRNCSNTVIVVSLEGNRELTDLRRGRGVYAKALGALDRLRDAGVLTGLAVTVGSANIAYWSEPRHIDELIAHSGPLAMFIEEIPASGCESGTPLTIEERIRFRETVVRYRERASGGAFIVHSPGDEEFFGGCVSAGRGFAHVNPSGDVTACPVSPLATHNVKRCNLREALASPLFAMIRENGHLLETEGHPCGLSAHAEELESMAKGLGAYRTGTPESAQGPVTIR